MKKDKRKLVLNDFEYRLLVGCVNKSRTMYIDEGKPTADISALLIKIIDTPTKRIRERVEQNGKYGKIKSHNRKDVL